MNRLIKKLQNWLLARTPELSSLAKTVFAVGLPNSPKAETNTLTTYKGHIANKSSEGVINGPIFLDNACSLSYIQTRNTFIITGPLLRTYVGISGSGERGLKEHRYDF